MLDFRPRQLFKSKEVSGHGYVYIVLEVSERTIFVRRIATAKYTAGTYGRKSVGTAQTGVISRTAVRICFCS